MKLNNSFSKFLSRWLPVIGSMGIIFISSADYNPYRWLPAQWFDGSRSVHISTEEVGQLGHFMEFALLGYTVFRAVVWQQSKSYKLILVSIAFCFGFAISDEIHQLFVPGRAFQIQDLLIDGTGTLVGVLLKYMRTRIES